MEKRLLFHSLTVPGEKKGGYFCLAVDLRLSALKPRETPSGVAIPPFLRLLITPFIAACPVAMCICR